LIHNVADVDVMDLSGRLEAEADDEGGVVDGGSGTDFEWGSAGGLVLYNFLRVDLETM
jgi:hypothetical protein